MSNTLYRLGTASQYDSALRNITQRQNDLANLQDNLTSGKRVVRASDDPVAAAQAERALTRLSRTEVDKRALDMQRNSMALAESALGEAGSAMQDFRQLVVNAGNGAYTQAERDALVRQLTGLKDQIMGHANRQDSNGLPLFQSLGSAQEPYSGLASQVGFAGLSGQATGSNNAIANVLDGDAAWMRVPKGNGVFTVDAGAANSGKAWSTVGQVTNPSAFSASPTNTYTVTFSVSASGDITYDVPDATPPLVGQPYTPPTAASSSPSTIAFDGISIGVAGVPANGDTFTINRNVPGEYTSVFQVLQDTINAISKGGNADGSTASGTLTQGINKGLAEIDAAMNRLQASRGLAGDLLNRADSINGELDTRAIQLEADRSRAEDLDMIQGYSDFQNQQVGYQAALKSYSMVQKLSLFNYIA